MGASGINWINVPHETIVDLINGGAGVGPVNNAADSYRRMAGTLRQADGDLRDALVAASASWEGHAASDMNTAATPLAAWAEEADQLAAQTGSAAEVFGQYFSDTRTTMPPPVKVPAGSWVDGTGLSGLPGVTTDHERAEAAADAAHQEAARKMEAYDDASYDTVRTQYFSQPPTVTLEVPPPSTAGGSQVASATATSGAPADARAYVSPGGFGATSGPVSQSPQFGGATGGPGTVVPASPTAPSGAAAVPTLPAGTSSQAPPAGGNPPGGGLNTLPPPVPGLSGRPGSGGPTSDRPEPVGGVRPGIPGAPGNGSPGPGRPGSFGPGLSGRPGSFGPGLPERPGSFGPGYGQGGYSAGGFGPGAGGTGGEAHGQRGLGPSNLAALPDAEGRATTGRPPAAAGQGAFGPMGAGTRGDEDTEHKRADYLVETEDIWGDGARVAPPVIGDQPAR